MNFKEQIYLRLRRNFNQDALTTDSSRGFKLTSVKAQYVVERLNEVLGLDGWSMEGSFNLGSSGVLYTGKLKVHVKSTRGDEEVNHEVEAIGFSMNKKNMGDSYKSARTDALSKAASWIGVANEVYKGNVVEISPDKFSIPDDLDELDARSEYERVFGPEYIFAFITKYRGDKLKDLDLEDITDFLARKKKMIDKGTYTPNENQKKELKHLCVFRDNYTEIIGEING